MKALSIIIPAFNEKMTIRQIIEKALDADVFGIDKEIIVVDDGSTDGTREIIKNTSGIRYIFHEKNLGKGGAVKTGYKNATGDIVIVQDADLEYDPNDYAAVIAPILSGSTEATNGVRMQQPNDPRKKSFAYWLHWFGNGMITWTTNFLYGNNAREYEGCYKAFTKKLVNNIEIKTNNFDFDNELIVKILKRGYKVVDVPIHYYPRDYSAGKKINWKHGFIILWTIIKYRFID
jgi:glycosyltransferase involved in cell wall biosynthesis